MSIVSLAFACFVLVLVLAYYLLGRLAKGGQWIVLLVGSLGFYALQGTPLTMVVLVAIALVTWLAARWLGRLGDVAAKKRREVSDREEKKAIKRRYQVRKRVVLWASLAICVAILSYFKYWNVLLCYLRVTDDPTSLGILLPLGISFYTMQSMGYLIDAYNGTCDMERNFARHLLFVSYFPQMIQGPINKSSALGPQLFSRHRLDVGNLRRGLLRSGYGMLKKVCVANVLGGTVSKLLASLENPAMPGSLAAYALLLYSIQMYADFSGGIDMVEGVSELFGIRMARNFEQPYFSTSLANFWQRWHMSLGAWMRDYVFYPLAVTKPFRTLGKWGTKRLGRQVGRSLPACIANVVVFTIVGIWHGIEAHYVAWGLFNGLIIAFADLFRPVFDGMARVLRVNRDSAPFHVFAIVRTFVVVNIGRYFDCIPDLGVAVSALQRTFLSFDPDSFVTALSTTGISYQQFYGVPPLVIAVCLFVFVVSVLYERGTDVREGIMGWWLVPRLALYVVGGAAIAVSFGLETVSGGTFLYANF
ncbi:MAG: MBOAT family protein [Atopobiaceae bacterium]|nr:MBOAT family protein [Atopobiaceae bacterium]